MAFFKEPVLTASQLNAENQVTDKKILGRDRLKFGVGCIMYQNEENALGPIHTMLVQMLGGNTVHIGILGCAANIGSLIQWFGAVMLKISNSNKKAMNWALSGGVIFGTIMAGALLLGGLFPSWMTVALWLYLLATFGLASASGLQNNIESSWIGDLVPKNLLGWFTSAKWMIGSLGLLLFLNLFGLVAKYFKSLTAFSGVLLFVALSHAVAILLMSTITDRKPQTVNLVSSKNGERLNYADAGLWYYCWFYVAWAGGRTALATFTAAFLLAEGYDMMTIAFLFSIQPVVNLVMLWILGKISDKSGARLPLLVISATMSVCMLLWPAAAWIGLPAIVIYQVINGMAGNVHAMLSINFGLELFPAKGRAAYIGFSRVLIGIVSVVSALISGYIIKFTEGFSVTILGATLNHYHLFFAGAALFTVTCVFPLLLSKRVYNKGE